MNHKEQVIAVKLLAMWSRADLGNALEIVKLQNLTVMWQSLQFDATPKAHAAIIDQLYHAVITNGRT